MFCFLMDPAAVEKMLLYSDPHGFQKLKQNSTHTALVYFESEKRIHSCHYRVIPKASLKKKKKNSKSAVHAKKQTKKEKIVRDNSVRAINSLFKN